MNTEAILTELKTAWMNNTEAADRFGFAVGDDFDSTYSKVSILSLIFYVVAYVTALKETLLSRWKEDVRQVGLSTHYGTAAWWVTAAKEWQYGDSVMVVDGRMGYETVTPSHRIVTAASVTAAGRALTLKVAKVDGQGGYSPLTADELESFQGYVDRIKPLGIYVDARSGQASPILIIGSVSYSAERSLADMSTAVHQALRDELDSLGFDGTVYVSRLTAAIVAVDGVVDCRIESVEVDGQDIAGSTTAYNGHFRLEEGTLTFLPVESYR